MLWIHGFKKSLNFSRAILFVSSNSNEAISLIETYVVLIADGILCFILYVLSSDHFLLTVYILWPELRTFPNTFLVVYWDNEVRKCTYSFVARSVYIIQTLPKHNEYLLWEKDGIPITYLKNSITNTTYWVLNGWTQGLVVSNIK